MNRKQVLGVSCLIGIGLIILFIGWIDMENQDSDEIFHVRLANPQLYDDLYTQHPFYSEGFFAEKGAYEFRFVASGDSPQKLSIKLLASSGAILMDEHFELEGTLIDDGISSWYTWDYLGEKRINFDESQRVRIIVDPNGDSSSSVSVGLYSIK